MNLLISTLLIIYPFQVVQCTDIFEQVRKDSMDGIKKAIAESEDVINIPGPGGQTPLIVRNSEFLKHLPRFSSASKIL